MIEDDHDIRESILDVLRAEGFLAEGAASSREAIQALKQSARKPDLILLDLRLPGEDGFCFREEQKRDPRIADIPVVLLSADTRVREKEGLIGAIDSLKKPMGIDELLDTVRRTMSA